MEFKWHFSDESSQSNKSVDKFADSKFSINRWTSFTREIIQNSLDARDDASKAVRVVFDLNKELTLDDIPEGRFIKSILERCSQIASNSQTRQAYQKGVEILSKPNVYCLKVSDYNTVGVRTGRNEAWGALVFDEGITKKQRPGSAGSHGVGKKVPFIISTCNTVFYATKNKYKENDILQSDLLVQGKTALINWINEKGVWKCPEGWYGKENPYSTSPLDKILPLMDDDIDMVHPYFARRDGFGTDVIMVGVNAYESEEAIKKAIISSIYENFFVAIKEEILEVSVFGTKFTKEYLDDFLFWYTPTETLHNSMQDLIRVYSGEFILLPVLVDDKKYGDICLYFDDSSELNRKYYTIVREHGMKIKEYRINRADKPFSALAIIKGEELNKLLSSLENAAHDDFVTQDEDMDLDQTAVKALKTIKMCIEDYIVKQTKIDDGEDQNIEDLYEILTVPGFTPKITKKDSKPKIKKNKINKLKPPKPTEPKPVDPVEPDDTDDTIEPNLELQKSKVKSNKFYNAYAFGPVLLKNEDGYLLRFKIKRDMEDCEFRIKSINSDNKVDDSIADLLVSATVDSKNYEFKAGCISNIKLSKDQLYEIQIKTKRHIKYRLMAELWYREA